jgi:threonine aldolase
MRRAIAEAVVGDDVFKEDPTVLALEERLAGILGKEAAIYVPSGTMSNQIAVRVHCGPGDEFLCETGCHIFAYEQAGYAQLSGVGCRTVDGELGVLRVEQLDGLIRSGDDHVPFTKLVCLENTHNRGGGRIQPLENVSTICQWAHDNGLATHLDGARLFNAVVATGVSATEWGRHFDTVSVCFSKGLGAPVGSALAGPRDLIVKARRARKLLGGGMRQAGIIAAGALYALENHVERLAEDHVNAKRLGEAVSHIAGLRLPGTVDTNIVIFDVAPELGTAHELAARLRQHGVLVLAIAPQRIRAVTHLDVDEADTNRAVEALGAVVDESRNGAPVAVGERSVYE